MPAALISSGLATWPILYRRSAAATAKTVTQPTSANRERLNMAHLAAFTDKPLLDPVVVVKAVRTWVQATNRDKLFASGLVIAGLIDTSRLQHGILTVP